jgi:GAF domain-containing protein
MESIGQDWHLDPVALKHAYLTLREEHSTLTRFLASLGRLLSASECQGAESDVLGLLDQMLRDALDIIQAKDGSVLVLDPETHELAFLLTAGDVPSEKLLGVRIPAGQGVAGWVASSRRAVIVNNSKEDARFYPDIDCTLEFCTESILAVPIIGGGEVLGVIEALNKKHAQRFSQSDKSLLMLLARVAGEVCHSLDRRSREGVTATTDPPQTGTIPLRSPQRKAAAPGRR